MLSEAEARLPPTLESSVLTVPFWMLRYQLKSPTLSHGTTLSVYDLFMDGEYEFWTYIVGSNTGTLYVGFTNNIMARVAQHKSGKFEGFASKHHCNRLLCYEKYVNVFRAIAREKQLKGWRRSKKIALIESTNPRWEDLAASWGQEMLFANQSIKEAKAREEQKNSRKK
jgi:putative endonuclease